MIVRVVPTSLVKRPFPMLSSTARVPTTGLGKASFWGASRYPSLFPWLGDLFQATWIPFCVGYPILHLNTKKCYMQYLLVYLCAGILALSGTLTRLRASDGKAIVHAT